MFPAHKASPRQSLLARSSFRKSPLEPRVCWCDVLFLQHTLSYCHGYTNTSWPIKSPCPCCCPPQTSLRCLWWPDASLAQWWTRAFLQIFFPMRNFETLNVHEEALSWLNWVRALTFDSFHLNGGPAIAGKVGGIGSGGSYGEHCGSGASY